MSDTDLDSGSDDFALPGDGQAARDAHEAASDAKLDATVREAAKAGLEGAWRARRFVMLKV